MAKTISKLHVGIGGDYGGLAKTFKGAAAAAQGFGSKLASIGGSLARLGGIGAAIGGAIAGFMTIGKAVREVTSAFENIDVVAKLADRLGFSTEQLTGLQHAANLAGISADELTGGLEYMTKNLGKAAEDGGAAAKALNSIGLNADKLAAMAPDDALKMIADRMAGIENPAERAAAVVKVFGKSGQGLLPLLSEGAAGIAKAQREAEKLGLTFSRIDAKKVEEANDAITRLKAVGTGIAQRIAIGIAPVVEGLASKLTELAPKVKTALNTLWTNVTSIFTSIYNYIAPTVIGIYNVIASRWEAIVYTVTARALAVWHLVESVMTFVGDIVKSTWNTIVAIWDFGTSLITGSTSNTAGSTKADFGSIIDTLLWMQDTFTTAINIVEYTLKNWQLTAELVGLKVIHAFVTMGNQAEYVLTEVIPTAIGFVIAIEIARFENFYNFTTALFSNLGSNIVSVFKNLPGLIKGSTKWGDIWTPLTKGFEEQVVQWPGIAEREKGEFEKALEGGIAEVEEEWAKGLAKHLTEREQEAQQATNNILDFFKNMFKDMPKPEIPNPDPITPTLSTDTLTLTIQPEIKRAQANRIGSAEEQLLRYGGPRMAAIAAAAGGAPGGIAAVAAPPALRTSPVTAPSRGQEEWFAGMRETFRSIEGWLNKIEKNTSTPQLATADI